MEWNKTKEGHFDTWIAELENCTLKAFTTLPNGTPDDCMGLINVHKENGKYETFPLFDKENNNAHKPIEEIKEMLIHLYNNLDTAVEYKRNDVLYGKVLSEIS